MRRVWAIALLLVVTAVSSAPAWAFAVADHACCAPGPSTARTTKDSATGKTAATGKHAHCAAMAAQGAESVAATGSQRPSAAITARHACQSCALSAISSPRTAASVAVREHIALSAQHQANAATAQVRTLQNTIIRSERGPPNFLL